MIPPLPELFDEHADFVWRVLRRHGVREAELEDACQEVFIVVHRRRAEFEGRSSVRTWLYGIATRTAWALRRRANRRRERPEEPGHELPASDDPEKSASDHELVTRLLTALAALPERQREVFELYEFEGLSMRLVAEAIGVPETTATSRLVAARAALKEALEPTAPRGLLRTGGRR